MRVGIDLQAVVVVVVVVLDDLGVAGGVLMTSSPNQPCQHTHQVTLEKIMERVPDAYQRAIFSMHLSSRFFYENGATADPLKFYQFMKRYDAKAR